MRLPWTRYSLPWSAPPPRIWIDETVMPMMGRRGYVWLVKTDGAAFIVATPSRSGQVAHTLFDCLIGKYSTADGHIVHKKLFKVHRCRSHELNVAKDLATRGGAVASATGSLINCVAYTMPPR